MYLFHTKGQNVTKLINTLSDRWFMIFFLFNISIITELYKISNLLFLFFKSIIPNIFLPSRVDSARRNILIYAYLKELINSSLSDDFSNLSESALTHQ